MSNCHHLHAVFAACFCIAVLASCSPTPSMQSKTSSEPTFTGAHAEDYSWAYDRAKRDGSEFAVQALSDDKLAEAEVQEAADRYVSCMTDKGYTATMSIDGTSTIYHPDQTTDQAWTDRMHRDTDTCEKESGIDYLAGLLLMDKTNPDGKNDMSMIIDCMRRHDVVDDSMTDAQIEAELNATSPDTYFSRIPLDMTDPNYDANKAKWSQECRVNPREF